MSLGLQTNGDIATGMFMYGPLTPADVLAAKSGTLNLTSTFPGGFGTTPTNNLGQTPSSGSMPAISVNFTARTATIAASSIQFSGPSPQLWSLPGGTGPITVVPGAGGFFLIQGSGGSAQGYSCTGTGCNGANFINAKAGGIFFGPVGDHAGVTLGAQGYVNNFTTPPAASFGAVRLYCASGC
jgi:hypothetical protein